MLTLAQPVFRARSGGYFNHRIPALVATAEGSVLAFCAARYGIGDDWDTSDLVVRRSEDGGQRWGDVQVLAGDGKAPHDNAAPIAARDGTVHLLYSAASSRLFYRRSLDDGLSFSEPREITEVLEGFRDEYLWNVAVPAPGHGVELKSGRLLVPVWMSTGGLLHRPSAVATIFSDDGGKSWRRGEMVCGDGVVKNPSESTATQLSDGRVMLVIRNETPRAQRLLAFSADGASGWETRFAPDLREPVCMGSLIRLDDSTLCYVGPNPPTQSTQPWYGRTAPQDSSSDLHAAPLERTHLSAWLSLDDGQSWQPPVLLDAGFGAYSDLTVGPDGTLLCLYESGAINGNMFDPQALSLLRLDARGLKEGSTP
ncbi:MAG: sialidase family protein [Meiothermus sp.]|nr:sialidase family protein [Meiothermus sp.]